MQIVQTVYCSNHAEAMILKMYVQGEISKVKACIIMRQLTGEDLSGVLNILNLAKDNGFFDHNGSMIVQQ
jgi:hypothetical protein